MGGLLEEELCYFGNYLKSFDKQKVQFDLLIPLKKKS